MRKILSLILISFCCLVFVGCESGNTLRTASFTNITMAGSDDYTFRITFSEDERVDERYYDIQIKADGEKKISIGKEFEDKKEIQLSTMWNSLTSLLVEEPNTETFTKGKDAVSLVYIFNAVEKTKVTLRVVVGGIEQNAEGTGQIITSPEDASNEFTIETK